MPSVGTKRAKIVSSHHVRSEAALTQAYALATISTKHPYKHAPKYEHAEYMEQLIRTDKLRETVAQSISVLSRMPYFDAIAFRGNSGAIIAPTLALALDKTMLMVRKNCSCGTHSFCHSYMDVEGDYGAKTYIIVDDIISSGATARIIVEEIKKVASKAKCLGVLETYRLDNYIEHPDRPLAPPHSYAFWNDIEKRYEL